MATELQIDPVGLWDQWCVLSDEPYIKTIFVNGEAIEQRSLLNEENCRKLLANFAAQKDNLPCTLGHQHTTADKAKYKVAEYSAMALFVGGALAEMSSHEEGLAPPTIDMLPRGDNGDPPEDGIYVFRKFLTDLGKAVWFKQAVKKTSPEFLTEATDQHNNPIGPLAQGLAWTDSPFLDGCEIKYERSMTMHKKLMEAGCMETDSPAEQLKKLYEHYGKKHMMDAGIMPADGASESLAKFMKHMEGGDEEGQGDRSMEGEGEGEGGKTRMEGEGEGGRSMGKGCKMSKRRMEEGDADKDKGQKHKEPDADNEVKFGEDPIVKPGAPTYIDEPEESDKVAAYEKGPQATIKALSARLKESEARQARYEKELGQRKAKELKSEASAMVERAWGAGQIVPHPHEKDMDAKARFQRIYEKSGVEAFNDALAPKGTHSTRQQMGGRLTGAGLPLNFERGPEVEMEADRPDLEIVRLIEQKKKAGVKGDAVKLARQICLERPELGAAYRQQSKAALWA